MEQVIGFLVEEETSKVQTIKLKDHFVRKILAVVVLHGMMQNSGPSKADKVRAALDYADLLMKG